MQTLRKKTSPCKYRNDPGRFFGDGVTFKAKLIGILEVGEARGDRMCQEALQDLKMAIRAAGEHKQRITIHVTIEGLRLRDEKTGDSLYHHPVHKISFIAQDMTDSRAFGYIFGSPDSGHRFFGIKTDKAASQVVLAMRDLFQVVFELKKKEIEMARQQIQSKTIHEHQPLSLNIKGTSNEASNLTLLGKSINESSKTNAKEISPESVADLVDLEQELSSIQRGITQMERITPSEPTPSTKIPPEEDPFGDSFTNFPTYNLLPPPESSRSRHSKPSSAASAVASTTKISDSVNGQITTAFKNLPSLSTNTPNTTSITSKSSDNWLGHNDVITHFESSKTLTTKQQPSLDMNCVTSTTSATATTSTSTSTSSTVVATTNSSSQQQQVEDIVAQKTGEDSSTSKSSQNANNQNQYIDAFTDLDPLGTGKSKPYVDKKYFFHELKNPPKKVLKELSGQESSFPATFSGNEVNDTSSSPITITLTDPLIEKPLTEQNKPSSETLAVATEEKINNYSSSSTYSQTGYFPNQMKTTHADKPLNIDLERTKLEEPVMMPRDTDPFSPTRKKSDPFQDGDIFSKLDPFEFEFMNKSSGPTTSDSRTTTSSTIKKETTTIFNGPLQVNLPPESGWNTINATTSPGQRKIERQTSESPTSISRNRPSVFKQNTVDVISSISSKKMPHLFGQKFSKRDSNSINMRRLQESDSLSENETAPEPPPRPDTTSYIEPPPLPPKKQFSDIVIRPRITSSSAIPPPTRYEYISSKIKSSSSSSSSNQQSLDSSAPPIPLPSRKVGRIDSSFPGPGRPARKPGSGAITGEEDDYLTPITMSRNDVPPLLPPPETKGRGRRSNYAEVKPESENAPPTSGTTSLKEQQQTEGILPDITLTQLLTLGIDELAMKLNVPTTKLSTMTLVELTSYLSEFIESRKKNQQQKHTVAEEVTAAPVFKVNFDQNSEATFVAKFDDNFGEEPSTATTFVANFSNLDMKPEKQAIPPPPVPTVPSADRYAVFREIIDQEIQEKSTTERNDSSEIEEDLSTGGDGIPIRDIALADSENETAELSAENISATITPMQVPKIDTKITEAISHAKDRYAALRDIILVEDLFEKPVRPIENLSTVPGWQDEQSIVGKGIENTFEESLTNDFEDEEATCPQIQETKLSEDEEEKSEINQKDDTIISTIDIKQNGKTGITMQTLSVTNNKDDIEIDELMNRAISNLSLDSREHLSPNQFSKSPIAGDNATVNSATSPNTFNKRTSPSNQAVATTKAQFSDVSTSPVHQLQHQQKSPVPAQKSPLSKSPIIKSPVSKSPVPQSAAVTNLIDNTKRTNSGSLSDMICGSSPETNPAVPESSITKLPTTTTSTPPINADESWAVFDKPNIIENNKKEQSRLSKGGTGTKDGESPCSSDGKDDWKGEQEYGKKWPRGHTSSSSRDLSPWDDETADYKKRIPAGADRHGYYMRHARRMNSCDDDYEYEDDMVKRRDKRLKPPMSRSRENFDSDSQNWYQSGGSGRHNWSPPEDDERLRQFDRSSYERSTYGPPYDKRHPAYDRREYSKSYDKRKYYREYSRPPPPPDYEFESPYGESPDIKDNRKIVYYGDGMGFEKPKSRRDYENIYEEEFIRDGVGRTHKSSSRGEYFYERDRKSFDRDSVESYESTGRRHKSFGSGDVYGSLDSREDFRERYLAGGEKSRSLRKGMKMRAQGGNEEYEQDSENEIQIRRPPGDTRSLQRPPQGTRIRKSSGSSPWDGEEIPPIPSQKGWKRPSSASESDRRLADNRRVLCHTLSGSDGEKDRRFRKKSRPRGGKEIDGSGGIGGSMRQANVPMTRYRDRDGNYDYIDYEEDDYEEQPVDEDKFERLNRRRYEMHQRMIEIERRKRGDKYAYERPENIIKYSSNNKDLMFTPENDQYNIQKFDAFETPPPKCAKSLRREFDFEDLDDTPRSNASSSSKFNFDEHGGGFESDFNSPPQTTGGSSSGGGGGAVPIKSSFRFSNDFSDNKDKIQTVAFINDQQQQQHNQHHHHQPHQQQQQQQQEFIMNNQTPTQKLRFDDKVTISKFENEQPTAATGAFEDDFSQAQFVFDNDDQWNSTTTVTTEPSKILSNITVKNHLRLTKRQDNIKKSESVNIFARKNEDPFEDDDFFKSTTSSPIQQQQKYDNSKIATNRKNNGNNETSSFQWDNNFAKFDENM